MIKKKNAAQLVNQDSGMVTWGSAPVVIDAVKAFWPDGIGLDVASSAEHNKRIGAHLYWTKENDSMLLEWCADSVWMNHPFSKGYLPCDPETCQRAVCKQRGYHLINGEYGNVDWILKLEAEYQARRVGAALNITFASTGSAWGQLQLAYPTCFLYPRTPYIRPDTGEAASGVTRGSMITYRGYLEDVAAFSWIFGELGKVMLPDGMRLYSRQYDCWYRRVGHNWMPEGQMIEDLGKRRGWEPGRTLWIENQIWEPTNDKG